MNRIIIEPAEIEKGCVVLSGRRFEHIKTVLKSEVGDILKTGELNGKIGTGKIAAIDDKSVTLEIDHSTDAPPPWFDLILAPPRPRVFKRLLAQLTALGLRKLFLVGAKKVEKDFWGATILKEENYRPLLIEGLEQCGATALPEIRISRNLKRFVESQCLGPCRLIAHPGGRTVAPWTDTIEKSINRKIEKSLPVFAVGPEGGWTDDEVALFEAHGFSRVSLGPRILRTDTALLALIGRYL